MKAIRGRIPEPDKKPAATKKAGTKKATAKKAAAGRTADNGGDKK